MIGPSGQIQVKTTRDIIYCHCSDKPTGEPRTRLEEKETTGMWYRGRIVKSCNALLMKEHMRYYHRRQL